MRTYNALYRELYDKKNKSISLKGNNIKFNMKFLKGSEIVKKILDILKLIYKKDEKKKINFVYREV